jgi:hypothetical protein
MKRGFAHLTNLTSLSLNGCHTVSLESLSHLSLRRLIVPGYSLADVQSVFGTRLPSVLVTRAKCTFVNCKEGAYYMDGTYQRCLEHGISIVIHDD